MPTLYLTEDYAVVKRDTEDCLLIQNSRETWRGRRSHCCSMQKAYSANKSGHCRYSR